MAEVVRKLDRGGGLDAAAASIGLMSVLSPDGLRTKRSWIFAAVIAIMAKLVRVGVWWTITNANWQLDAVRAATASRHTEQCVLRHDNAHELALLLGVSSTDSGERIPE